MNNLILKTTSGFLTLMVILGIILFLPAGSYSFWQAWVYLGVWAACVIPLTSVFCVFLCVSVEKLDQGINKTFPALARLST
ncbi:MAG: hypothetical protein HY257_00300 [Chloroflexi bacterium]|nr:hypothetical protein [Chloroflexota bacterium]